MITAPERHRKAHLNSGSTSDHQIKESDTEFTGQGKEDPELVANQL